MHQTPQGPADSDHDSTDTLPLLSLRAEDVAAAGLPPEPAVVRVRPRVTVPETQPAPAFASTDTFQVPSLAPLVARPVATAELAETLRTHERHLQEAIERVAELESRLGAANRRCTQLEQQCAKLQSAAADAAAATAEHAVATAAAPRSAAAPAAGVQADEFERLQRENRRLHEALSTVHARSGVQAALLAEAEAALQASPVGAAPAPLATSAPTAAPPAAGTDAARDPVLRIDWQARFGELEAVLEAERASAAARARDQEAHLARLGSELAAARASAAQAANSDPPPPRQLPIGSSLRVLVREDAGTEFVYPLGRHTTIGRTPDNDIQVNTTFVSRHHAVLLTSSEHCIIEDLNSTNGIAVNGHRVGRQLLQDGDIVTVGKTHFRYETR